jgi:hypothetical protein
MCCRSTTRPIPGQSRGSPRPITSVICPHLIANRERVQRESWGPGVPVCSAWGSVPLNPGRHCLPDQSRTSAVVVSGADGCDVEFSGCVASEWRWSLFSSDSLFRISLGPAARDCYRGGQRGVSGSASGHESRDDCPAPGSSSRQTGGKPEQASFAVQILVFAEEYESFDQPNKCRSLIDPGHSGLRSFSHISTIRAFSSAVCFS